MQNNSEQTHFARLLLICLLLFFYALIFRGVPQYLDTRVLLAVTRSLASTGTVHLQKDHRLQPPPENRKHQTAEQSKRGKSTFRSPIQKIENDQGIVHSIYGLGQPLLAMPLYKVGLWIRSWIAPEKLAYFLGSPEEFLCLLFNPVITCLICLLFFEILRLDNYPLWKAFWLTLVLGLGTNQFSTARTFFNHPIMTLMALAAFYFFQRARRAHSLWNLFLAGFFLGYGFLTRITIVIVIGLIGLYLLIELIQDYRAGKITCPVIWAQLLVFTLPICFFIFFQSLVNYYIFGKFTVSAYFLATIPLGSGSILYGLRGLLFSPSRSFFLYSPPIILALLTLFASFRRGPLLHLFCYTVFAGYLLAFAQNVGWFGGFCFGPRYLNVTLPFLMLLIALLYRDSSLKTLLIQTVPLFLIGFIIQFLGSITYFYPRPSSMSDHTYLFSLKDSQLWALFRRAYHGEFETWYGAIWALPYGKPIVLVVFALFGLTLTWLGYRAYCSTTRTGLAP